MNISVKDNQGLTICPVCKKHYKPDLAEPSKNDKRCIQNIYPQAKPYQREQLLSGVCSDECWNELWKEEDY